eukprot:4093368-Karenia_brevis.AAC.1
MGQTRPSRHRGRPGCSHPGRLTVSFVAVAAAAVARLGQCKLSVQLRLMQSAPAGCEFHGPE